MFEINLKTCDKLVRLNLFSKNYQDKAQSFIVNNILMKSYLCFKRYDFKEIRLN